MPGRSSVLLSVIYLTLISSPQIGHNAKSSNSLTPVCILIKSSFPQLISIPHFSQIPLYLNFLIIWIITSPHLPPVSTESCNLSFLLCSWLYSFTRQISSYTIKNFPSCSMQYSSKTLFIASSFTSVTSSSYTHLFTLPVSSITRTT